MSLLTFGQIATNMDYGSRFCPITFHRKCYSNVSTHTLRLEDNFILSILFLK